MQDQDRYWDCLDQASQASDEGRLDEALAWIDEALRANPRGAEAHNRRGEILWDNGRAEEAHREFGRALKIDGRLYAAQLNRIELMIEEFQQHEEALDLCDELLHERLEPPVEAEIYYLKAKALFYVDDLEGALFLLRRAVQVQGEVAVYRGFEGQILFELGRFDESRRSLERALQLEPDSAHSLYHMALVEEHAGDRKRAETLFTKAAELAPDLYPLPVRMDEGDFERAASEALESLPPAIRRYVQNCPILIEDLPSLDLVRAENLSPQVLGLFVGTPSTEPGASPTFGTAAKLEPDRILLFKRNLEKMAQSRDDLIEQVQITVKHEIGHYLGLDEDELDRLGLA